MKDQRALEIFPSNQSGTIDCRCKGCNWHRLISTAGYDTPVDAALAAFRSHECANHPTPEAADEVVARILRKADVG